MDDSALAAAVAFDERVTNTAMTSAMIKATATDWSTRLVCWKARKAMSCHREPMNSARPFVGSTLHK